jgi:hypothetical protein
MYPSTRPLHVAGLALPLVLGLAACGGSDSKSAAERITTVTVTATAPAAAATPASLPADVIGTYTVKRPEGAFPAGTWKLAIGPRGEVFITPPGETGFFSPPLQASGDQLIVPADAESGCNEKGTYSFAASGPRPGGSLTLTAVTEPCRDRAWVMANAWTRTD